MELSSLTIAEAGRMLRRKECSAIELATAYMREAEEKNPKLRAYLELYPDAEHTARRADELLADARGNGESSHLPALLGIPLAIKDNILIQGKRVSAGSRMLENYTASYDATVITKLKNHGAVFLGRTNMDEFAMGSSTENSAFGPTRNPRDPNRVPGGSSGGSAAAVAADMCLGALGSDTGGSIRQPASFCGVVGMKPTYGRISRHGLIPMAASLNQIGPLAKTVDDAELLFEAIAGGDDFDAVAVKDEYQRSRIIYEDLQGVRIGVPKEYFMRGLDPDVEVGIRSVIQKMEHAGGVVQEISLPHASYALPTYYIIAPSEVSADLARFDGIRYGQTTGMSESYEGVRAAGFGPEVKRRIMLGAYALSAGYYDAYYRKAQQVRRLIRNDFDEAFKNVDIIVGPTTPTPAFCLGDRADDPLAMYLADIYTVAVNLAGLPALSMPAGSVMRDSVSLPIGMQMVAPRMREDALFAIARAVERVL